MSDNPEAGPAGKVNWVNECVAGAMLSAIFTVMAAHSGAEGVATGSFVNRMHDFIILGGITMTMVCGFAAVLLIMHQVVASAAEAEPQKSNVSWKKAGFFGTLQTAKFIKIFLP